ncbi:hypothetical protein PMAYCL1PPCAC_31184, partial [Pristionchus mayeri]
LLLNNCQKVFYRGTLILIRNENSLRMRRASNNVIVIGDPELSENCRAYTGDHIDFVYITNNSGLLCIVNAVELTMTKKRFAKPCEILCVANNMAYMESTEGIT